MIINPFKKMIDKSTGWVSKNKWRIATGYGAVGIFGMGLVIAKTAQDVLKPYYFIPMYILFPLGVLALWLTGYLYDSWGFYSKEIEYASERNTYFQKHLEGKKFENKEEVKK